MKTILTLSIICLLIWSKSFSQVHKKDTVLNLKYVFKAEFCRGDDYGSFSTYSTVVLYHNNIKLFTDTNYEYELGDKLYPIVNAINLSTFEILLEVNDRPSKNFLWFIRINRDKVIKKQKLPTFISKPLDLEGNNILYFAGYWGYNEVWGNKSELTDYNPILYYKLSRNGIVLDSALTVKKNTLIYGKFMGFEDSTDKPVSVKLGKKFQVEIAKIKALSEKQ
jgi:hypothetical protein